MRRWLCGSAAVLCVPLVAAFVPVLWSGGKAEVAPESNPAAAKIAKSKIERVTVYPNSALVTREVDVPEGTGLVELTITPMPDQIVPSTMYSEGSEGIRVLTTRFTTRQVLEDTSEERRKLETELEKIQVLATKIDSEIGSLQKNLDLMNKLESITEKGKHTGDEVIAMAKYVMEQRLEKAKEMVGVMEQKRLNAIQLNFIQRKMGELGRGSGRQERDAIVVVDRAAGKAGTIRLNYLVGSVAWHPEYKVRAGKVTEDVQVDYQANLMQHSGEDWNQVKMTLSTAQPMLNASPPELCMLQPILVTRGAPGGPPMPGGGAFASPFANSYAPAEISKKAAQSRGTANALSNGQGGGGFSFKNQKDAEKLLNDAAANEQNLDLMRSRDEVLAEAKNKKALSTMVSADGPSVTYHLPNKLTVPSRNDEQVVEVAKLKLAPKYYYKTVPVLNTNVYRLADLCNKSEYILLPGEATMFQGTDFVGRMPMPLVAIGEDFTAGFGVETQLQIQRPRANRSNCKCGIACPREKPKA
jgi:hypothetical protein